jgi:hypothetical protein
MIAFVFLVGAGFGAVVAWAWFERTARPRDVRIIIDQDMARRIDQGLVLGWLDSRGLTWMPKGMETVVKGKTR